MQINIPQKLSSILEKNKAAMEIFNGMTEHEKNEIVYRVNDTDSPSGMQEIINGILNTKTAVDNQWTSTGLDRSVDENDRRDGPGGEDSGL